MATNLNKNAFDIARNILLIKEKGLWKFDDLTQPYKDFNQWYDYAGIPVKWETARQWILIYKKLIQDMGYTTKELADIDFWKLRLVCQVANQDPGQVQAVLEQAKILSYRDLALAIKQNGMEIEACTHQKIEEITMYRCVSCKQVFRNKPDIDKTSHSSDIDSLIIEFMEKTELKELSESHKESRRYASLLLKKYPREMISDCIEDLLQDKFWRDKLSKLSQVYREMPKFERDSKPIG